MTSSPTTQELTKKLLFRLRTEQYAALTKEPIDWDKVDRLGRKILALEIHRRQSTRNPTKKLFDLAPSAA